MAELRIVAEPASPGKGFTPAVARPAMFRVNQLLATNAPTGLYSFESFIEQPFTIGFRFINSSGLSLIPEDKNSVYVFGGTPSELLFIRHHELIGSISRLRDRLDLADCRGVEPTSDGSSDGKRFAAAIIRAYGDLVMYGTFEKWKRVSEQPTVSRIGTQISDEALLRGDGSVVLRGSSELPIAVILRPNIGRLNDSSQILVWQYATARRQPDGEYEPDSVPVSANGVS